MFGGCWRFLTGADVLDHDRDVSLKVLGVSVIDLDMVTGLWYTHIPSFGSLA